MSDFRSKLLALNARSESPFRKSTSQPNALMSRLEHLQASIKKKNTTKNEDLFLKVKLKNEMDSLKDSIATRSPLKQNRSSPKTYKIDFGSFGRREAEKPSSDWMDIINKRASSISRNENIYSSLKKKDLLLFDNNISSFSQTNNPIKPTTYDLKNLLESTLKSKREDLSRKTSDLFENRLSSSKLLDSKVFDLNTYRTSNVGQLKSSLFGTKATTSPPYSQINEINSFLKEVADKREVDKLPNSFVRDLLNLASSITKTVKSSAIF